MNETYPRHPSKLNGWSSKVNKKKGGGGGGVMRITAMDLPLTWIIVS